MRTIGTALFSVSFATLAQSMSAPASAQPAGLKPNILVIWGDDVGQSSISAHTRGLVGYQMPRIDRASR